MEKLLTLRRKVDFYLKNKVWLREENNEPFTRYGISLCHKDKSKWIAFKNNGNVEITKISNNLYHTYENEDGGLYIFGTEGIFYKANETNTFRRIFYKEGITGMYVCIEIGIVLVFMLDGNDIIGNLFEGMFYSKMPETSKIRICRVEEEWNFRDFILLNDNKDIHLCISEGNKYFYTYVDYLGVNFQKDVYFETADDYMRFLDHKLVVTKYTKKDEKEIVTLLADAMVRHASAEYVEKIKEGYYFISDDNIRRAICTYDANEKELEIFDLVDDVKEWSVLAEILGVTFVKIKNPDGITIVAIYEHTVVTKKYPRAIDIKFSKPTLLSNGNLLEVKPIAVYEEVVTE